MKTIFKILFIVLSIVAVYNFYFNSIINYFDFSSYIFIPALTIGIILGLYFFIKKHIENLVLSLVYILFIGLCPIITTKVLSTQETMALDRANILTRSIDEFSNANKIAPESLTQLIPAYLKASLSYRLGFFEYTYAYTKVGDIKYSLDFRVSKGRNYSWNSETKRWTNHD